MEVAGAARGTIVVAGSVAQRPLNGGHTWAVLQYVLGFRRLGWRVLFLDRLEPEMCHDRRGRPCSLERSLELSYFLGVMRRFGLEQEFALFSDGGGATVGLSRKDVVDRVRGSALLLNVMGFLTDEEVLGATPLRVFLDIDPGFGQMWRALGLADPFVGHDRHVTIAERMGRADCAVPAVGIEWQTTRPPVVLDEWPVSDRVGSSFTTVASWRGPFAPIEYEGTTYGLRVHEFRRLAPVPDLTGLEFEIALDIDSADAGDSELLERNGWRVVEPRTIAADPDAYRRYIAGSLAEFSVAKNMYVQTRGGWFSDRSACYLASGRPVVAQDTGFSECYPTGEGLLAFTTIEEACSAVEEVSGSWQRHSRAARTLAEDYFDAGVVLGRLLARLGVG